MNNHGIRIVYLAAASAYISITPTQNVMLLKNTTQSYPGAI